MSDSRDRIIIECECMSEALVVDRVVDDRSCTYEIALWRRGNKGFSYDWKWRLRNMWQILREGHPYADSLVLDDAAMLEMVGKLSEFVNAKE